MFFYYLSICFLPFIFVGSNRIIELSKDLQQRGKQKVSIGDTIFGIDNEDVSNWSVTQIIAKFSMIPEGSKVRLLLEHSRNDEVGRSDSDEVGGGSLVLRSPSTHRALLSRQPSVLLGSASFSFAQEESEMPGKGEEGEGEEKGELSNEYDTIQLQSSFDMDSL